MLIQQDQVKGILDNLAKIEVEFSNTYKYDNKRVPRVTEILSAMLHDDSLMSWSNGLGWKRISYRAFMTDAANKGTYSHLAIEKYIKHGFVDIEALCPNNDKLQETVNSCLDGFILWWNTIQQNHKSVEVVFLEETLVHEWFGGTCDCLLKVDNKYWLIDFKTSNHMSYNYALQLAAYMFLLKQLKGIDIDKAIILRVDKLNHNYTTYELDLSKENDKIFIENCLETFLLLTAAYKMRKITTEQYHEIYGIEKYRRSKK